MGQGDCNMGIPPVLRSLSRRCHECALVLTAVSAKVQLQFFRLPAAGFYSTRERYSSFAAADTTFTIVTKNSRLMLASLSSVAKALHHLDHTCNTTVCGGEPVHLPQN